MATSASPKVTDYIIKTPPPGMSIPLLRRWLGLPKSLPKHCLMLLPLVSFHPLWRFRKVPIAVDTIHSRHKIQRTQDGSGLKVPLYGPVLWYQRHTNKIYLKVIFIAKQTHPINCDHYTSHLINRKVSLDSPLALHVKCHTALISN